MLTVKHSETWPCASREVYCQMEELFMKIKLI